MTVIYKTGDIFTTTQPAIGHGVNTKGVMGAGIAKTIRRTFPDVYETYRDLCHAGELKPGEVMPVFSAYPPHKWVFNIASQDVPGPSARYEWLEDGVRDAFQVLSDFGIEGIALPRIGAGIGGLDWARVEPFITNIAAQFPHIEVELWEFKAE